nr:basic proline-rich protein-like [Manis javanica]
MPGSGCSLPPPSPPPTLHRRPLRRTRARGEPRGLALRVGPHPFPGPAHGRAAGEGRCVSCQGGRRLFPPVPGSRRAARGGGRPSRPGRGAPTPTRTPRGATPRRARCERGRRAVGWVGAPAPGPRARSPPSRPRRHLAPRSENRPPRLRRGGERAGEGGRRLARRRGRRIHLHLTLSPPGSASCKARPSVNGKMEMDVEGVSPRSEPIPRSQGAGGACPAPPPPPQPQPRPRPRPQHQPQPPPPQQLAQDDPPGESAGAEDSDDPEARPHSEKGESKRSSASKSSGAASYSRWSSSQPHQSSSTVRACQTSKSRVTMSPGFSSQWNSSQPAWNTYSFPRASLHYQSHTSYTYCTGHPAPS